MNEAQLDPAASSLTARVNCESIRGEHYYQRQLAAVTNNSTFAMFIMDEHQQCTYMNPAAEQLTGFTLAEVEGKALHDIIHHTRPDGSHYPLEECPIDRAFPQNSQEQGEEVFVHKDGSFYPVAFTASPIRQDSDIVGTIIEVRGTSQEKQRKAERDQLLQRETEAREESETLYALGQLLSAELDLQKLVQAVTDAATDLTGAQFGSFFYNLINEQGSSYTLYSISGVPREAFSQFPMPRATALFGATFRGEGVIRVDDIRKDPRFGLNDPYHGMPEGHLPVVSYLAVPVITRSGEVLGGLFFGHSETGVFTQRHERLVEGLAVQTAILLDNANLFESVRQERARAESAYERTSDILESITDAFFALDEEWCFTYINQKAEALIQRTSQELMGKSIWESFPEAVGSQFQQQYQRAITEQVTVLFEEYFSPLEKWFEVRAYPLQDGLSVFFQDITQRVEFEQERSQLLERAQKAREDAEGISRIKDEFLATLSHELRTPLTAIIGWSQIISGDHLNEEAKAQGLEVIRRNANLQAQLVEDILDVSRIITGKLRLEARPMELSSVIEDAVASVVPAAQAKGIRLQRVLDSGSTLVSGDPVRLQQAVWNLLSNAIKFTPKNGRVQVRLERINSHIEIIVTDTGPGIDSEVLPYIFDRFRQADQSSTREYGGLGLGLSIVRHIVEMHGGTADVESPGSGQGATFTVKLPLLATRSIEIPSAQAEPRVHPTAPSGGNIQTGFVCPEELDGLHVLVVDDDEDSRLVVKAVLESCRARVTTATSAAEGLLALQSSHPDILVSDIGMPGEDGYSFIRKVRTLSPDQGGRIPAAALTAYARIEDRLQVLRSGFQIHLPKPIEPTELVAVVANLSQRIGP